MKKMYEGKPENKTKRLPRLCSSSPLEAKFRFHQNRFSLTGQAALEVAILGTLILVVFATVLSYGQRFDSQVDLKMEAFRKALNRAYARNAGVSYTLKKDKRFYSLLGNFGEGQPTNLSASATVMWQKGLAGCQDGEHGCDNKKDEGTQQGSFAYYEINNQLIGSTDGDVIGNDRMIPRYPKKTKSYQDDDEDEYTIVKVPASVYFDVSRRKTNITSTSTKRETPEGAGPSAIDNRQDMALNESIYTISSVRYDAATSNANEPVHIPQYVYEGENYSFDGNDDGTPENYNIFTAGQSRQGAYYNTLNNRIEYDPVVQEGDSTTKTRNWHTTF
ncbi:MAG: hypothetical protein PHI86_01560 [Candidatus Omnitrophica bacterium]|nr:hypothetical protein [Candidatus Omnitrophota bacterium]HOX54295.1 hypothetical protein [Candidatus Omnitrophota bacterium]